MTCSVCGKDGCHPNYHKSIMQIVEECGPEESVRILTDLLLHASGASVADRARLAADRFVYGVAVEDQEGRRVDPTTVFLRGDGTYTIVPVLESTSPAQLTIWDQMSANGQKDLDAVMDQVVLQYLDAASTDTAVDTAMHMEFVQRAMSEQLGIPPEMLYGPTDFSGSDIALGAAAGRRRSAHACAVCGGETVVELGRPQRRCVAHPEHDT